MDHVVYTDAKAKEIDSLIDKSKTMIIRGATGRKLPHGRVNIWDILYFINNDALWKIKAKWIVNFVFNSEKMTEDESKKLVNDNQNKLQLTPKQYERWAWKRYIVLIWIDKIEEINPFFIDKSEIGNMDDWLPVEDINKVKIK